ncbi:hypothetical protein TWF730_006388 [Orbilia blumenaviensis]|uniref:Tetraspanin n=1 Tax=Orbilia blumenaviensis TaxID=1796055 RepID=A0AAV9VFB2_9PEZI
MKITNLFTIIAALVALITMILGILAWWTVSKYSLPFSLVLPILTTVLGPGDLLATCASLVGSSGGSRRASKRPLNNVSLFINLLLLILPAVMTGLAAPALGNQSCQMRDVWQGWFKTHNENAIKAIQDSLQCCGFASVKDMPYPFPRKASKDGKPEVPDMTCANILGHMTPCAPAWEGELKSAAGFVIGGASLAVVWKLFFLMIVVGNPKGARRWFVRPTYGEYESTRAIESNHRDDERSGGATRALLEEVHDDEDEEEQHDREALGSQVATYNAQTNGNGSGERGRLLPKDYGGSSSSNNNQIRMYDNSLRTGLGDDAHERWREDEH